MFGAKKLACLGALFGAAAPAFAEEAHHGVASAAEKLFEIPFPGLPLPVTNSMVTSWVVAIVLIVAVRLAVKRPQLVPSRGQAIVENLVEGIYGLIEPIVGKGVAKHTFPLLISIFTFILIQNWAGLFPGVGTIGVGEHTEHGFAVTEPWLRPGTADMNMTVALAIVAFVAWFYFIMRYAGPALVFKDIFGNKADKKETPAIIYYPLFLIFIGAGLIEIISILFRPVSLSFRLFGNVYGGENLMHAMSGIMKWGLPAPFYFLELLIGFVQAFVFTLLVSVYIGLICNHGDEHHGDAHGHAPAAH